MNEAYRGVVAMGARRVWGGTVVLLVNVHRELPAGLDPGWTGIAEALGSTGDSRSLHGFGAGRGAPDATAG